MAPMARDRVSPVGRQDRRAQRPRDELQTPNSPLAGAGNTPAWHGDEAGRRFRESRLAPGLFGLLVPGRGMDGPLGYRMWLPVVVTVAGLFLLVFGIARVASDTWADLLGLFYLLASPFVYRSLRARVGASEGSTDATRDGVGVR